MSNPVVDRNLLFGLLALQNGLINRDQLVSAFNAWIQDKSRTLPDVLVEQQVLSADRRSHLQQMVDCHIQIHGEDPAQSLAVVSSVDSARLALEELGDADIHASLRRLDTTPPVPDPNATKIGSSGYVSSSVRYTSLRPHAKGGLGEVSVALDHELHREVALKEIQPQFASDQESRERFILEAEITGGLEHPGIVPVYGLGQYDDGRPFYAMRFIKGDSLKIAIAAFHRAGESSPRDSTSRQLELRQLLRRFIDVCNAVEYAHSRGVLHRDLKPGNVMLGKYGETLVVDWGLAKSTGRKDIQSDERSLRPATPLSNSGATQAGRAMGTPAYMSPEQAEGRLSDLGPATDIYGLGATLYHLLTGTTPFEGKVDEVISRVIKGQITPLNKHQPRIPAPLSAICLKAMSLRPIDRYASAKLLADDIERWLADERVTAYKDTSLGIASRWARRHRAWAMSGTAALAIISVISSVAAVWINSARSKVVTAQLAEANQLKIALRNEKEAERQKRIAVANSAKAVAAQKKAEAAARAESHAKGEEARQRQLAIMAAEEEKRQRLLAEESNAKAVMAQKKAEAAVIAETKAKQEEAAQRKLAIEAAADEKKQRLLAEKETQRANDEAERGRRNLYAARMNLAQNAWQESRMGVMQAQLLPYGPGSSDADLSGFEWMYWNRQLNSYRHSLQHEISQDFNPSAVMAFSPDGKHFASARKNGTVTVWDVINGKEVLSLKGHPHIISCLAFTADGNRIVTGSLDLTVKIWDATKGNELFTLKGHTKYIRSLVVSPFGGRVVSLGDESAARVWDTASGRELFVLHNVGHVVFSPDGSRLVSPQFEVWEAATGKKIPTLTAKPGYLNLFVFSPDGRRLASFGADQTVKVVDFNTGVEMLTLQINPDQIARLHVDTSLGTVEQVAIRTNGVFTVTFSPDGSRLVTGGMDGLIKVWDSKNGRQLNTWNGHVGGCKHLKFHRNHRQLVSIGDDGLKVWDVTTGERKFGLKWDVESVDRMVFDPQLNRVATASDNNSTKIWEVAPIQEPIVLEGLDGGCLAFSDDGKQIAGGGGGFGHTGGNGNERGEIRLWDTTTGEVIRTIHGHTWMINDVAFSKDGKWLVSGGAFEWQKEMAELKIWDLSNGREVLGLKTTAGGFWDASFSPDGKRVAARIGGDRSETQKASWVKVWDIPNGKELLALKCDPGRFQTVAFSPDGQRLATGINYPREPDKCDEVKLWDSTSGEEILALTASSKEIGSVRFSPDGQRLFSVCLDKSTDVWDTVTGKKTVSREGSPSKSTHLSISPDGKRFTTVLDGQKSAMKLWDISSGREVLTLKGHEWLIYDTVFSSDGTRLATVGTDSKVILWDARPWTAELRIDQEAMNLISILRGRRLPQSQWVTSINANATLTESVKDRAVQLAQQMKLRHDDHVRNLSRDLDLLLKLNTDRRPLLLTSFADIVIREGETSVALEVAGKLRQLQPRDNGNIYDAACIYARCLESLASGSLSPTAVEISEQQKIRNLAIECLKESIAAGWNDFAHMSTDKDLISLHGRPGFEALFPKK